MGNAITFLGVSSLASNAAAMLASTYAQQNEQVLDTRETQSEFIGDFLPFEPAEKKDLESEFKELVNTWKAEKSAASFVSSMVMHPAYQQIIGMGPKALPWILRELEKKTDHWFWALKSISRQDPVPPESRGTMREMRDAWLKWGRDNGYVW
jgi:hypothetical protein